MLTEHKYVEQFSGEPRRRWFSDEDFDLIVWLDDSEEILGFQLCYDKLRDEHSLTWWSERGFAHTGVDDGEGRPARQKATPILVPDGEFRSTRVAERFLQESRGIDQAVVEFVYEKLVSYGSGE
jgi:hypothetical protein